MTPREFVARLKLLPDFAFTPFYASTESEVLALAEEFAESVRAELGKAVEAKAKE